MLLSKYVQLQWNKNNKRIYENKGYPFTKYGDLFDVKVEDLSKGSHDKIKYQCDFCGQEFSANYNNYMRRNNKTIDTCKYCKGQKNAIITLEDRQESLYNRVKQRCDELHYDLLTPKNSISGNESRIKYKCPKHGVFDMKIANFLIGKKCPQCYRDVSSEKYRLSKEEVVQRIKDCGGEVINADEYINQSEKNLKIKCPDCGEIFVTSLCRFTQHGGQVCEKCRKSSESIGEKKIRYYLERNNINFKQEYYFDDCKDKNYLPFDFYLPDLKTIIEFDGRQHFGSTTFFKHSQETTPIHDEIKNKYCEDNNINIIRIPYWNINNIDRILDKQLYS